MKQILLLISLFVFTHINAQSIFVRADSVPVFVDSLQLLNPWAGGINSAQFSDIDLNQDGAPDLFIFDRSGNKITTYINGGTANQVDYKFDASYVPLFPRLKNWVILRDYNCDGKMDIFTAFSGNQSGIAVWKNISNTTNGLQFQLIADSLISDFTPNSTQISQIIAVSNQDIPAIRDVDGDGDLDILTFDPSGVRVEYHRNMSKELYGVCDSLVYRLESGCWGEFSEDFSGASVTLFAPCAPVPIGESSPENVFRLHSGSCLECIQLQNDSDQDLLLGDLNSLHIKYLENGGTNTFAQMDMVDDSFPSYDTSLRMNFFPCAFHLDVNNDGKKDVIISPNSPYSAENHHSSWYYENINSDSNVIVTYADNSFMQNTMIDLGESAYPVFYDYDGDGDKDLFIGNYGYYPISGVYITGISLYKNIGNSTTPIFNLETTDFAHVHTSLPFLVGTALTFGDLDGDGDKDMLLGDFSGRLTWFRKNAGPPDNFSAYQTNYQGIDVGNNATPQLIDVDRDGKIDLLIGETSGNINYYRNTGTASAPVFTLITSNFGNISVNEPNYSTGFSAPFMYDSSGTYIMLVGSERGWINRYDDIDGNLAGSFIRTDSNYVSTYEGGSVTVGATDINNDGLQDVIIGNLAGGVALFYGYSTVTTEVSTNFILPSFNLFPNPVNDHLTVFINERSNQHFKLFIYDLSGNLIYDQEINLQTTNIATSNFSAGMYICTLQDENGISVNRKFVIAR
ncbi:hypothetical protein BH09BAC5_BH09BAC5_06210 [soil metagenome]